MKYIFQFVLLVSWLAGAVIASGFWSTLFAVFIPFWAWYLFAERLLTHFNLLG